MGALKATGMAVLGVQRVNSHPNLKDFCNWIILPMILQKRKRNVAKKEKNTLGDPTHWC